MIRTSTLTGLRAPTGSTSFSWMARRSFTCAAGGSSLTSSRNSVPPDRLHELAGMAIGGAGEGALLVAEQDRLDEVVRDGAAVDRDERL